jgi:hypothetical protein
MPQEEFEALWPGGVRAVAPISPAPRPASLAGKRVGFIWDYMFRGDEIFPVLQHQLASAYPGVQFVGHEAFGSTFGGDEHAMLEALPQRLRELDVDAVISGIGC